MGNMYKNSYIHIFLNKQCNTCWKNFKWSLQLNLGCVIKMHCGDVHRQNKKNGAIIQILMSLTVWFFTFNGAQKAHCSQGGSYSY